MLIDNYMTVAEAAYRWNLQDNTLKKRIKPSTRDEQAIQGYLDKGLLKYFKKPGAIRGEWILTRQLMEEWYGDEVKRIPVDEWEANIQHTITDEEALDRWVCDINTAHSQYAWYGLDSVFVVKYLTESHETFYAVEHESVTELVKQTESNWTIKQALLHPTYEGADRSTEAVFTSEDAAFAFTHREYPQMDVKAEVDKLLGIDLRNMNNRNEIIQRAVKHYQEEVTDAPEYTPRDALTYILEELDTGYDLTENEWLALQAACDTACAQMTDKH